MTAVSLTPRQESRLLATLAGIQFTHILDFMIMMPLAPMLTRAFGLSPAQFGLLVSIYTLAAAVTAVLAASAVDRFDRRKLVLALYAAFTLATAACALAPSYWTLMIARAAAGAFGGVLGAMVQTYIGDTIPYERRGRATGIVMAAFSLSTVVGVPLGLFLASHVPALGWRAPFLFAAVLSVGVWFFAHTTLPSIPAQIGPMHVGRGMAGLLAAFKDGFAPIRSALADANHLRAYAFMALMMFASFSVIPFITLYLTANVGLPETLLPLMYLLGGAGTFFTSRWFGKLADRYGKARVYRVLALCAMVPILLMTHLPPVPAWVVMVVSALFFVLVSGRFAPGMAMVTSAGQPRVRGAFMTLNTAVGNAASGAAAFMAGLIVVKQPDGTLLNYNVVGYVALAAGFVTLWLAGRVKPVDAGPAPAPEPLHVAEPARARAAE
ncbi:MFS transporter [Piscinibacterium candidicorallinum]|uniref:MFS transporter n=1 Tax=Piscinibacterium candidicorallinum TaxID=1793872 RepID=A0ABV7H456_9BURK